MGSDVLLGHTEERKPVFLRYGHRTKHVAVLGKSGYGKTTLLEHLVLEDMRSGTSAVVIDAHGDLTDRLISLAPAKAGNSLILVEPNSERPFGLNLYECPPDAKDEVVARTVGQAVEIFHKVMGVQGGGLLPVIDPGLRNTARLLIANGLTMAELPRLYADSAFRQAALHKVTNPYVRQYWQDYEAATPQRQQDKRDPILNKVGRFLEDELLYPMVSQPETTIPFKQVMNEGGTLILNLARLDRESISFVGMVFLSILSNLIHQRDQIPKSQRRRVHLYLDEYGRFATPTTRRMLQEVRTYELGITIAHQDLSQTPDEEALKVESLIVFQLSPEDAQAVAPIFAKPPPSSAMRQGISQHPLESLDQRPHPDPEVRRAVRNLVGGLHRLKEDFWAVMPRGPVVGSLPRHTPSVTAFFEDQASGRERTASYAYVDLDGGEISTALEGLNRLLVQVMEEGTPSQSHSKSLVDIVASLARGACGLSYFRYALDGTPERPCYDDHVKLLHLLSAYIQGCLGDVQKGDSPQRSAEGRFPPLERAMAAYDPGWAGKAEPDSYAQLLSYVVSTMTLYAVLARDPILIPFGSNEGQRSYADMQAEAEMEIRNLPPHVAYCKITDSAGKPCGYKIEASAPASIEEQAEQHYFDNQLRKALRISSKIRGAEPLDIHQFSGHSHDIGTYFRTDEFRKDMSRSMQEWRYGTTRKKRSPITSRPLEIEGVRSRSREHFGTARAQVEEESRRRREYFVEGHAGRKADHKNSGSLPVDRAQKPARAKLRGEQRQEQIPETNRSVLPPIGRRSPMRSGEAGAPRTGRSIASALDRLSSSGEMRVYELANELGVESAVVMEKLDHLNLFVRSPNSILKKSTVQALIDAFREHPES
ncbi:hypothetical protein GCM10010347_33300 [Streptomyces cirratus]|uniref:Uncharacterized protein n=1 Tax=Streptomyces cirratus TaxID=68187 RepID=A0ABQ3ETH7_9ACTN|nr:translation initiation factor IF-2 N-terminal domain-containing protein [Streptomyces cirratus]GHB60589.1 hypothetical protein GCM10010347_33300 [Streptomyces cirratus]